VAAEFGDNKGESSVAAELGDNNCKVSVATEFGDYKGKSSVVTEFGDNKGKSSVATEFGNWRVREFWVYGPRFGIWDLGFGTEGWMASTTIVRTVVWRNAEI
jgi:hypothetical protein